MQRRTPRARNRPGSSACWSSIRAVHFRLPAAARVNRSGRVPRTSNAGMARARGRLRSFSRLQLECQLISDRRRPAHTRRSGAPQRATSTSTSPRRSAWTRSRAPRSPLDVNCSACSQRSARPLCARTQPRRGCGAPPRCSDAPMRRCRGSPGRSATGTPRRSSTRSDVITATPPTNCGSSPAERRPPSAARPGAICGRGPMRASRQLPRCKRQRGAASRREPEHRVRATVQIFARTHPRSRAPCWHLTVPVRNLQGAELAERRPPAGSGALATAVDGLLGKRRTDRRGETPTHARSARSPAR